MGSGADRHSGGSLSITRRSFVVATGSTCLIGAGPSSQRVIKTRSGSVAGIPTPVPGVTAWLGIPFAAPPVGARRWRPPEPPEPWPGVRPADRFGATPCQPAPDPESVYYNVPETMSEDCLTLNVWAPPRDRKLRPVMVWIFGGAFVAGSSSHPLYDGANLAGEDVIFVSINYRVGILGFYANPDLAKESHTGESGNYGLLDQIAALRWVRDNIAAFGGDPDNVTIFGQSAGAFSVGFHLVIPESRGLFHRAIAQSGAPMGKPSSFILLGEKQEMEAAGTDFAREVGAHDIAALRRMEPMKLVAANSRSWRFYPMIDGATVPAHPFTLITEGRHAAVPLIVGRNRDEGTVFPPLGDGSVAGLAQALAEVYRPEAAEAARMFAAHDAAEAARQGQAAFGDIVFNWNSAALAFAMATSGRSAVYSYRFDYGHAVPAEVKYAEAQGSALGAFHGAEIGFALRTQEHRAPLSPEQARLMHSMSGQWLAFAAGGDPNRAGLPRWPRYVPATPSILKIDGASAIPGKLDDRERLQILGKAMGNRCLERA